MYDIGIAPLIIMLIDLIEVNVLAKDYDLLARGKNLAGTTKDLVSGKTKQGKTF